MIKAVLFDYGGVLSSGGKNFRAAVAKLLDVAPGDTKIEQVSTKLWDGQITSKSFFQELSQLHGKTITPEDFLAVSGIMDKNQRVYDLAAQLRQYGIKTGMLSNMYKSSADSLRQGGHYDNFDPIILSFEQTMSKPNPEFYQHAIDQLGVKPEEVLFIDDQERFLPPARELGMHVIKADSEDQIVADTKALFKKENGLDL